MLIMRGDACTIYMEIKQGKTLLTPEIIDDVEVCIGTAKRRRRYTEGTVLFDQEKQKWSVRLSQTDTFAMVEHSCAVIARVKFRNVPEFDVRGIKLGDIKLLDTISREVL